MNLQSLFPVTLSNRHWHDPKQVTINAHLARWLLDPNSLTARLKSHCQQFNVELLGQRIEACQKNEATALIPTGEPVLVREVLLFCDHKAQVFARSLLPLSSLTGAEQALANLGTKPLGEVLFNNPLLQRQTIEVAEFDSASAVMKMVKKLALADNFPLVGKNLWGRRSLFVLEGKPLMVAEVFLPGAFAYQVAATSGCKHA